MSVRTSRALTVALIGGMLLAGCTTGQDADPAADGESATAPADVADDAESVFATLLEKHQQVPHGPEDLPSAPAAYVEMLDEHGADLSECTGEVELDEASCPRPTTMADELEETVNIQLILDASGSMREPAAGGTKMQVAHRVLGDFVSTLPQDANVSLRVFGHEGRGTDADRERSCASSERILDFTPAGSPEVQQAVESVEPAGWTPLELALDDSRRDFKDIAGEGTSNFVYLVSDGIETCGGDPVAAAERLSQVGVGIDVNIVGFDVDAEAAEQLREAAEAASGSYYDAATADELDEAFDNYDWDAWTQWYNCRWDKAHQDYNETWSVAYSNYNCVWDAMYGEYNAIWDRAYGEYNELWDAAYGEYNAIWDDAQGQIDDPELRSEVLALATDRRSGLIDGSQEIRDFVVGTSRERRDILVRAAREERVDLVDDARDTREQIVEDARSQRDGGRSASDD